MRLIFHGSAGEVGRSCIEMVVSGTGSAKKRFLLDAGFKVHGDNPLLPESISDISDIEGVFITHSHMDHIGALPYLHHQGISCPFFMTPMTRKLARIMLDDSLHLELLRHHHPAYSNFDVKDVLDNVQKIQYFHLMKFDNVEFEYIPSGHIPGSSMILIKAEGKTILYSGDINDEDTMLLHGMRTDFLKHHKIDAMICESTYGDREHKPRDKEYNRFKEYVKKTISAGGSVLIPSFAIGRAQEILMLLDELDLDVPIYLDGMAKKITDILTAEDLHIRNHEVLEDALKNVTYVGGRSRRHNILHEQCVIVTTSGMVSGGPVMEYIKHFWHDSSSSILLMGFQGQGTNGRMLKEKGEAYVDGMLLKFRCKISSFDFSGHAGKKGIMKLIKKASPDVLVLNHGDSSALSSLKESSEEYVDNVIVPKLGSTIDLK